MALSWNKLASNYEDFQNELVQANGAIDILKNMINDYAAIEVSHCL